MNDFLQQLADRSKKIIPKNECDYEKDGLLYCGLCNTPKQGKYPVGDGKYLTPRILCKCETEKRDREAEEARRQKALLDIERLRREGIQDEKLLNCTFSIDNSPQSKHSQAFRRYCDKWQEVRQKNLGLILFGDVGTGKSFYSGCIANEIINRYAMPVIVTSIPRILRQLFDIDDKEGYIRRLVSVPLLVIDDLGAERETDYALEQVYTVIDERYKAEKPLIVTTNLSYEELKNPTDIRYKRIYDRVIEMCVPFNVEGVSRREEKARQKKQEAKKLLFE